MKMFSRRSQDRQSPLNGNFTEKEGYQVSVNVVKVSNLRLQKVLLYFLCFFFLFFFLSKRRGRGVLEIQFKSK